MSTVPNTSSNYCIEKYKPKKNVHSYNLVHTPLFIKCETSPQAVNLHTPGGCRTHKENKQLQPITVRISPRVRCSSNNMRSNEPTNYIVHTSSNNHPPPPTKEKACYFVPFLSLSNVVSSMNQL